MIISLNKAGKNVAIEISQNNGIQLNFNEDSANVELQYNSLSNRVTVSIKGGANYTTSDITTGVFLIMEGVTVQDQGTFNTQYAQVFLNGGSGSNLTLDQVLSNGNTSNKLIELLSNNTGAEGRFESIYSPLQRKFSAGAFGLSFDDPIVSERNSILNYAYLLLKKLNSGSDESQTELTADYVKLSQLIDQNFLSLYPDFLQFNSQIDSNYSTFTRFQLFIFSILSQVSVDPSAITLSNQAGSYLNSYINPDGSYQPYTQIRYNATGNINTFDSEQIWAQDNNGKSARIDLANTLKNEQTVTLPDDSGKLEIQVPFYTEVDLSSGNFRPYVSKNQMIVITSGSNVNNLDLDNTVWGGDYKIELLVNDTPCKIISNISICGNPNINTKGLYFIRYAGAMGTFYLSHT